MTTRIYLWCLWDFTKHRKRIQKFKETGDLNYIYKNQLDKVCFVHDAAYAEIKDLGKKTVSDRILKDRASEIALNPGYGYQKGLAGMMYKCFDKKIGSRAIETRNVRANINEELSQELHKPVIKKYKQRKVYSKLKRNIWQQIQLKWDRYLILIVVLNTVVSDKCFHQACLG